jgi:hypothetical protein
MPSALWLLGLIRHAAKAERQHDTFVHCGVDEAADRNGA